MKKRIAVLLLMIVMIFPVSSFASEPITPRSTDPGGGGDAPHQCRLYSTDATIEHVSTGQRLSNAYSIYYDFQFDGWVATSGMPHLDGGIVGEYYLSSSIVEYDDILRIVYVDSLTPDGYSSDNRIQLYDFFD